MAALVTAGRAGQAAALRDSAPGQNYLTGEQRRRRSTSCPSVPSSGDRFSVSLVSHAPDGSKAVRTHSRAEGLSGRVGRGYAHAKDEEGRGSAHAALAAAPFLADKKLLPDVKGCERTAGQPFRMRS